MCTIRCSRPHQCHSNGNYLSASLRPLPRQLELVCSPFFVWYTWVHFPASRQPSVVTNISARTVGEEINDPALLPANSGRTMPASHSSQLSHSFITQLVLSWKCGADGVPHRICFTFEHSCGLLEVECNVAITRRSCPCGDLVY